jgi:ketosteroid isomerase-like protein
MSAAEVMHRYVAAARSRDFDTAFGMFAEDIVFRIPGRSAYAGRRQGRDEAMAYINAARALSQGAEVELELVDVLVSEDRFCLLVNERFHRDGGAVDIRRANIYRVRGDEIAEIWIYEADQYEVDALLGAG